MKLTIRAPKTPPASPRITLRGPRDPDTSTMADASTTSSGSRSADTGVWSASSTGIDVSSAPRIKVRTTVSPPSPQVPRRAASNEAIKEENGASERANSSDAASSRTAVLNGTKNTEHASTPTPTATIASADRGSDDAHAPENGKNDKNDKNDKTDKSKESVAADVLANPRVTRSSSPFAAQSKQPAHHKYPEHRTSADRAVVAQSSAIAESSNERVIGKAAGRKRKMILRANPRRSLRSDYVDVPRAPRRDKGVARPSRGLRKANSAGPYDISNAVAPKPPCKQPSMATNQKKAGRATRNIIRRTTKAREASNAPIQPSPSMSSSSSSSSSSWASDSSDESFHSTPITTQQHKRSASASSAASLAATTARLASKPTQTPRTSAKLPPLPPMPQHAPPPRASHVRTPPNLPKTHANRPLPPSPAAKHRLSQHHHAHHPSKYSSRGSSIHTIQQNDQDSHDFCDACQMGGEFVCCEGCPRVFHFTCMEPPMDSEDVSNLDDKWYCKVCRYELDHGKPLSTIRQPPISSILDFFEQETEHLANENPLAFALPEEIRSYYSGVTTGRNGAYVDATMVRTSRPRSGRLDGPDFYPVKDKHDKFIFCFWCRKSSYRRPMIACDFCPLHWHLDCLDPATTTAPTSSKKWMCPCHKQHLDIRRRVPRHWAGHQAVSPIPFPSPFFVACETEGADEAKEAAADTVSAPQGGRKRVRASHDEHTTDDEPLAAVPVFRFQYMNHIFLTSVDAMDRDASSSPPLPSPTVSSTPSSSTPTPTPTTSATAAPNAKQPRTGGIRRKRRYFV